MAVKRNSDEAHNIDIIHQLPDTQAETDIRQVPIDSVGIRGLRWPMTVLDRTNGHQDTIGELSLSVNLPHDYRGAHMSRFVEVLNEYRDHNWTESIEEILSRLRESLEADEAKLDANFDYFIDKTAPATGVKSVMAYRAGFHASWKDGEDFSLSVNVPVMTLCPCSREISHSGAHNQRCNVHVRVRYTDFIWIEELVDIVESSASGELYSVLKRPDEKAVTEHAYDNPAFVEDVVRDVSLKLDRDSRVCWYEVEAESMESIHNHNAFARVERDKRT